jgi:hypothetical protein
MRRHPPFGGARLDDVEKVMYINQLHVSGIRAAELIDEELQFDICRTARVVGVRRRLWAALIVDPAGIGDYDCSKWGDLSKCAIGAACTEHRPAGKAGRMRGNAHDYPVRY